MLLASSGQRSGMLLNALQCPRQPPTPPQKQRIILSAMSAVLRLRNPALEEAIFTSGRDSVPTVCATVRHYILRVHATRGTSCTDQRRLVCHVTFHPAHRNWVQPGRPSAVLDTCIPSKSFDLEGEAPNICPDWCLSSRDVCLVHRCAPDA